MPNHLGTPSHENAFDRAVLARIKKEKMDRLKLETLQVKLDKKLDKIEKIRD